MAKLLYIESSPRKDRSYSIKVAKHFLETYRKAHPNDAIDTLDLWQTALPEFDGATINAKYRILHGQPHSDAEKAAWDKVTAVFNRFDEADKYLISLPMWNFGVPYKLKQYIDVITQPGLSFSFSPESGYSGLVTGKPAAVIFARGGEYSSSEAAAGMDYQKRYVDLWLGFIGFTDVTPILVQPTLSAPDDAAKALERAKTQAEELARRF